MSKKRSAALETAVPPNSPTAPAEADTPEALEARLHGAYTEAEARATELRTRLGQYPEQLAEIDRHMAQIRQEVATRTTLVAALPAQIASARVYLMGVQGTSNEGAARERLERLEADLRRLSADVPVMQTAGEEEIAALQAERSQIVTDQNDDSRALAEVEQLLPVFQRQIGEAHQAAEAVRRVVLRAQRVELLTEVEQREVAVQEARAALAAFDAALPEEMQPIPPSALSRVLDAFIALCTAYEGLAGQIQNWQPQGTSLAALLEIPDLQILTCLQAGNDHFIAERRRRALALRSAL